MHTRTVFVAALGRIASLGDLYDARQDAFCGNSAFRKKIPATAITVTSNPDMNQEFVHTERVSEKFKRLDVNPELQVSILGGLVKLDGSGRYLNDLKASARSVKMSMVYSHKTVYESLNISHDDLKEAFAYDVLGKGHATHVVTGISWGAKAIVSCSAENRDNKNTKEIAGKLSAAMKKLVFSTEGKPEGEMNKQNNVAETEFEVKIYGDILPQENTLPTTIDEALSFMKQIPTLVSTSNDGKGKPLTYELTPIEHITNADARINKNIKVTLEAVQEATILRVVQFVEDLLAAKQKLNDFHDDAHAFKYTIPPKTLQSIQDLRKNFELLENSFRTELSSTLIQIRSGKANISRLEELLQKFRQHEFSPENVLARLTNLSECTETFDFARLLANKGATYIGYGSSLENELLKDVGCKSVVFYFCRDAKSKDPNRMENTQLFFQELEQNASNYRFYAVDCDSQPSLTTGSKLSCVQVLQSGKVYIDDWLDERKQSWAKTKFAHEKILYKPNKRTSLHIPCSGDDCDGSQRYDWKCNKCRETLEYGFDSYVYCSCGRTPATLLTFKCESSKHGNTFKSHKENFLQQCLNRLRPFKEYNILILGKTGVGKSTWINSILNLVHFESLQDAMKNDLISLIPTKFPVYDENHESIFIVTGSDDNENLETGESTTQNSKVYQFIDGDTIVRLIDTPGIGDTRGLEQNSRNLQNILGTISNLQEIHGICILLKPHDDKLDVVFRFCINELLSNLHKDASKNIVFCFTHTRGYSYSPGGTGATLRRFVENNKDLGISISQQTMYCFDSDSFQFLAASKNNPPYHFPENENKMKHCTESWVKSSKELTRLLKHINGLKPHKIKGTVNLNHARESILNLTKVLTDISTTIDNNLREVTKELLVVFQNDFEIERYKTRSRIDFVVLDYPKTICLNSACNDSLFSKHLHACHNPCMLASSSSLESVGHPELLKCCAKNEMCVYCKHSYKEHIHTSIDVVIKKVKMQEVEKFPAVFEKNMTEEDKRLKLIELKEQEIAEYEMEFDIIQEALVKFAYFLKTNAITAYNDATIDYLNLLIENKKFKAEQDGNTETLNALRKMKKSYLEKKDVLEKQLQNCTADNNTIGPAEIENLIKELRKLPRSGPQITKAMEYIEHTSRVVYEETVVPVGLLERAKGFMARIGEKRN